VVTDLSSPVWPGERSVVTIGAYDGVHLGHRAVIGQVIATAADWSARSAVVTFDRHPASVVRPDSAPPLLTNFQQKLELLEATGVDAAVVVRFDETQAAEEPADFVHRVLVRALGVHRVVVGADFHFGKDRRGDVALLREIGQGEGFDVAPLELLPRADGVSEPISSTAIRRAVRAGEVERAAAMLGRQFEVRGTVVGGEQRGRTIGFPTANVEVPAVICRPADGVYAGWFISADGSRHACVMNLGRRPTFHERSENSLLEAHLFDFDGDLYGEAVTVQFSHFLRSEQRFDGVDALVAQVQADAARARQLTLG
jgi:riboflavin kinase/FMN adenylyltransferase